MAVAVPVDQAMMMGNPQVIPISSLREQLAQLYHLRAGGYLTQQELEAAKRRLLLGGELAHQHVVMGTAVAGPAGATPVVHQGVPVVTATAARVDGRFFAV
jgi:tetraacyldisaccharide-1-P 4'-kinase